MLVLCHPALALAALVSAPQTRPDSLERERVSPGLGRTLDNALSRFATEGYSGTVLVVRDRRIELLKGYGLADAERGIPNGPATRFEMNSMTKLFTGAAILQLDARGVLRVTDSVSRVLGPFPDSKGGATIEQLAQHTAGLIVEGTALASESRDAFLADVKRVPLESPPGESYRYTNAGYSVLAAVIELASGVSYEEYLRRNLFAPAGMRSVVFRDQVDPKDPRFAHGYVGTPDARQPGPPNPYGWGTVGAGGVWCTVGDIYRWLLAIESGAVLPEPARRRLFSPPASPSLEAYGWHVEKDVLGRARISKGGGSADFASQLIYYPEVKLVIIWTSNDLRRRWRQSLNQVVPELIFSERANRMP